MQWLNAVGRAASRALVRVSRARQPTPKRALPPPLAPLHPAAPAPWRPARPWSPAWPRTPSCSAAWPRCQTSASTAAPRSARRARRQWRWWRRWWQMQAAAVAVVRKARRVHAAARGAAPLVSTRPIHARTSAFFCSSSDKRGAGRAILLALAAAAAAAAACECVNVRVCETVSVDVCAHLRAAGLLRAHAATPAPALQQGEACSRRGAGGWKQGEQPTSCLAESMAFAATAIATSAV